MAKRKFRVGRKTMSGISDKILSDQRSTWLMGRDFVKERNRGRTPTERALEERASSLIGRITGNPRVSKYGENGGYSPEYERQYQRVMRAYNNMQSAYQDNKKGVDKVVNRAGRMLRKTETNSVRYADDYNKMIERAARNMLNGTSSDTARSNASVAARAGSAG